MSSSLRSKIERLLDLLARDPFENPPPFEKLTGDLQGASSQSPRGRSFATRSGS